MLAKRRNAGKPHHNTTRLDRLKLPVMKIKMSDYERYHHDKDRLKEVAELWLPEPLDLDATTDLETLRKLLAKNCNVDPCCFLDCKYVNYFLGINIHIHFMKAKCNLIFMFSHLYVIYSRI
jgi:diacylglycerol kinase (ATP)